MAMARRGPTRDGLPVAWADDPPGRVANGLTFDQFLQRMLTDYAVPGAIVADASADGRYRARSGLIARILGFFCVGQLRRVTNK